MNALVDMKALEEQLASYLPTVERQLTNSGRTDILSLKAGQTYRLRLLPDKTQFPKFMQIAGTHYFEGAGSGKGVMMPCPRISFESMCPVCHAQYNLYRPLAEKEKAAKSGGPPLTEHERALKELAQKARASAKYLINCIDVNSDASRVTLLGAPKTFIEALMNAMRLADKFLYTVPYGSILTFDVVQPNNQIAFEYRIKSVDKWPLDPAVINDKLFDLSQAAQDWLGSMTRIERFSGDILRPLLPPPAAATTGYSVVGAPVIEATPVVAPVYTPPPTPPQAPPSTFVPPASAFSVPPTGTAPAPVYPQATAPVYPQAQTPVYPQATAPVYAQPVQQAPAPVAVPAAPPAAPPAASQAPVYAQPVAPPAAGGFAPPPASGSGVPAAIVTQAAPNVIDMARGSAQPAAPAAPQTPNSDIADLERFLADIDKM